jgi:nitrite reductase/ring-hydroxylating ferredoxin subunit
MSICENWCRHMLNPEDNELITRVGPRTPMGTLMREYWIPALLSRELPTPDSDPLRVLLLGEQLIAFRDTNGNVGLLQNNCPHRGASLFFGRNEQSGLRCVYHGWKFDTEGNCIDMPNEPAESDFKHKVKATSYPTHERGGVVWAYLGPRKTPPPLPDLEGNMSAESTELVSPMQLEANWLQVLEGDIDTVHASLLHYGALKPEDQPKGTFSEYQLRQRFARFEVIDTEGGVAYGAYRPAGPGELYWRIAQWIFPFYTMAPPGVLGVRGGNFCRVPMDDTHTLSFFMSSGGRRRPAPPPANGGTAPARPRPLTRLLPNTTDWFGRFRTEMNSGNDFMIDREAQRKNEGVAGYTGISSIGMQDAAMTWSMGPIFDRSKEHLGSSDAAVIRVRRRMLDAARALQKYGTVPPGVDDPTAYRVRSGGVFLPEGAEWVEATHELRKAFVEHPDVDPAINGPL